MSSASSIPIRVDTQLVLRKTIPQDIQDTMDRCENDDTTESEEYQVAIAFYYSQFLCRLDPMPAEVMSGFQLISEDPTTYSVMWGPAEWSVSGTLKDWLVLDQVHKITAPTLLLNGRYDKAQDSAMMEFFARLPNTKWVQFAESSHMAQFEARERLMTVVGGWLMSK